MASSRPCLAAWARQRRGAAGRKSRKSASLLVLASLLAPILALAGCRPAEVEPTAAPTAAAASSASPTAGPTASSTATPGLAADAATRERLGIRLEPLAAATFVSGAAGVATIVSAAPLAELDADLAQAGAVRDAAAAALARSEALFAADQSISAAELESARREAAVASAELERLRLRLRFAWGPGSPFGGGKRRRGWLERLAAGRAALARIELPAGSPAPAALAVTPLGGTGGGPIEVAARWAAPADPSRPGPAWLALLTGPDLPQPGDRLSAAASPAAPLSGVRVPGEALVLENGGAFVYTLAGPTFSRKPLPLDRPLAGGFFAATGFAVGEPVVVHGAGLLLALETGAADRPTAAGDDDD